MWSRVSSISLIIILLIVGCSPRSEGARHKFESSTVDGVLTVTNSGSPKYREQLFTYEEVLRLHEDPDNEDSLLFRPRNFIQDESGYFYVLDYGNSRIAVFNPEGYFIRGIGRSGEGPGEFQGIGGISVDGDEIRIFDNRNLRLTRYRTDGSLIDVISLNQTTQDLQIDFVQRATMTVDNKIILIGQEKESTGEFVISWRSVAILGPNLEVGWKSETPRHKMQSWGMMGGRPALGVLIPFRATPSISYHPIHGILISPANEPILLLHDLDGTLRKRIRFEIEKIPITAEDKSRYLGSFDRRIAEASDRLAEQLEAMKEGTVFPDNWPFWGGAGVDEYGYIWLSVTEHDDDREAAGGGFLRMVLSPEGEYLGDVRLPTGSRCYGRIMHITSDEETDELILIVYQLRSAVAGFTYP